MDENKGSTPLPGTKTKNMKTKNMKTKNMKTKEEILEENRRDTDHFADQDWYDDDIIRMMEQYASEKIENEYTKILDSINRGLRKWGIKEKLSFEEGFDLLTALQDELISE